MEYYDNSKLQTYISCPREYYYSWHLKLEPDFPQIHLNFGSAFHEVLAYFYAGLKVGQDFNSLTKDTKEFCNDLFLTASLPQHKDKNLENASKGLKILFSSPEFWDFGEILLVEQPIFYAQFAIKVDLLTKKNATLYVIDHKTTGRLDSKYKSKWAQHRGFQQYYWTVKKALMIKYNCTRVVSGVNLFHIITEAKVLRTFFSLPNAQLQHWHETSLFIINDIKKSKETNRWPKYGTRCQTPGGCVWQSLCNQDKELKDLIIPSIYKKKDAWYC